MKVKYNDLQKVKETITKINFDINGMKLFLPVDFNIEETDEFGITKSKYKNESHYGSTLATGLGTNNNKTVLAFCSTVDLFSFNLGEFLNVTEQPDLTKEEINYISQFESAVCDSKRVYYVNTPIK